MWPVSAAWPDDQWENTMAFSHMLRMVQSVNVSVRLICGRLLSPTHRTQLNHSHSQWEDCTFTEQDSCVPRNLRLRLSHFQMLSSLNKRSNTWLNMMHLWIPGLLLEKNRQLWEVKQSPGSIKATQCYHHIIRQQLLAIGGIWTFPDELLTQIGPLAQWEKCKTSEWGRGGVERLCPTKQDMQPTLVLWLSSPSRLSPSAAFSALFGPTAPPVHLRLCVDIFFLLLKHQGSTIQKHQGKEEKNARIQTCLVLYPSENVFSHSVSSQTTITIIIHFVVKLCTYELNYNIEYIYINIISVQILAFNVLFYK